MHLRDVSPEGQRPAVAGAVAAVEAAGVAVTTSPTLDGAAQTCEARGLVAPGTSEALRREIDADLARLGRGPSGAAHAD